jgi:hypothetical protein
LSAEDPPIVEIIRVSFDLDDLSILHICKHTTVAITDLTNVSANCDPFLLIHFETCPVTRDYP